MVAAAAAPSAEQMLASFESVQLRLCQAALASAQLSDALMFAVAVRNSRTNQFGSRVLATNANRLTVCICNSSSTAHGCQAPEEECANEWSVSIRVEPERRLVA